MNIRTLTLLTFVVFVFASCKNGNTQMPTMNYEISDLDFSSWRDIVKIKESIILKADIPLSFPKKCIVGANRIVYWDSKAKRVYLFNVDGTFISQVGELGNAKNEYVLIKDIALNQDSTVIKILDESGILNYSIEDGRFLGLEQIKSDISASIWKFLPIAENHYLFFCDEGENTIVEYKKIGEDAKVIGLRKRDCFPFITEHFYEYDGKCRVISDFGEFYVDELDSGHLTQKYVFDLGADALPKEKRPQNFDELQKINGSPEYHKCIGRVLETEQLLYVSLGGLDLNYYDVFINKQTNKIVAGPTTELLYFGTCGNDFWAMPYPDSVNEGSYLYDLLKEDIKAYPDSPLLIKVQIDEVTP